MNIHNFHIPRYEELPSMPLYLDQLLNLVNESLSDILDEPITGAMIRNFIKTNTFPSPIKKKYNKDHICYLIAVSILKPVFSLQQISKFLEIQKQYYSTAIAYNYFLSEFENSLKEAFEHTNQTLPSIESKTTEQTILLRSMILTVSNYIYVKDYLEKEI